MKCIAAVVLGAGLLLGWGCSVWGAQDNLERVREQSNADVAAAERRVDDAEARDQTWLSLGDTAVAVLGAFSIGGGAVGTVGMRFARKWRARDRKSGEGDGAKIIIETIAEARRASPELDKAFDGLDDKTKRVIELVLSRGPAHIAEILKDSRRK